MISTWPSCRRRWPNANVTPFETVPTLPNLPRQRSDRLIMIHSSPRLGVSQVRDRLRLRLDHGVPRTQLLPQHPTFFQHIKHRRTGIPYRGTTALTSQHLPIRPVDIEGTLNPVPIVITITVIPSHTVTRMESFMLLALEVRSKQPLCRLTGLPHARQALDHRLIADYRPTAGLK